MATQAQIDANRRNASKSTGPRSTEGKRVVSSNAIKHGLCSEDAVIRGEDPADFAAFADELRMGMEEGIGLQNVLLVERIIRLQWKLQRLPRLEKRAIDQATGDSDDAEGALLAAITDDGGMLSRLERYEMRLSRELRACKRQLEKERQLHSTRDVNQAYCDGYNAGATEEATTRNRSKPLTPAKVLPEVTLEEPDVVLDEEETESAEQSQFSCNDRPDEELATRGDGRSVIPEPRGGEAEPSPYPLPEYRERDQGDAA